jgi:acetyl-CoA carboxylase biotin carboxylase subunit
LTEETPSPFMTDELRQKMGEAVKAAEYIKYEGGNGRVLVDKHRNFYFMDEYAYSGRAPITEQVIDYDLIREQIVAAGVPFRLSCTL